MADMGVRKPMLDNPYADSLETRISSATPLELVTILYDGAIDAVRAARGHLASREIHLRSKAITKAVNILIELSRSLNLEAGGELSKRLAGLYDFMQRSLLEANFRQTDEELATTERLLVALREAWATLSHRTSPALPFVPAVSETLNMPAGRSWSA
jgi:flagellar secretion chaperone FliS